MKFEHRQLDNGLMIAGEVNKSAKSAAVGFFVKTGSRDETSEINGVSHFLEHMIFKGTEKLSAFEVNEAFDRTGAQFNAFTSEEVTVYYAAILPEYLIEVTNLWAQLMRPALRDDDFNMEKNVIKQEIAMYKDLPHFDVTDRCRSLYFGSHPCGNNVLGSEDSIDALKAEQMRDYFNNRYAPNNLVLAVAGNFDFDEFCAAAEADCSNWKNSPVIRNLADSRGSKKIEHLEKPNLVCEHIAMMSPAVSAQDDRRFAASLLSAIIGDSTGSRYFWRIVDKAMAEIASMQFAAMDGTGLMYSYIRCSSENRPVVLETVKNIFAEIVADGVTQDELTMAKNKILSALVIKNEISMGRLLDLGLNWIYTKEYRTVEDDIKAVKAVKIDDIHALIAQFDPAQFTQFSIGPAK